MRNKVIINCSILHEKPTGLGVYAKNVVQEINNIENNKIAKLQIFGRDIYFDFNA